MLLIFILTLFVISNNAYYQLVTTPMTWQSAENHCISLGGHLASISTEFEDNVIIGLCEQATPNPLYDPQFYALAGKACWIGMVADPSGWTIGQWTAVKWTDGTPFTASSYEKFWELWGSYGDPYAANGGVGVADQGVGDCGFRSVGTGWSGGSLPSDRCYGWFMTDCTQWQFPFICDIDPCISTPTTQSDCHAFYGCSNLEELKCQCTPREIDPIKELKEVKGFPAHSDILSIDDKGDDMLPIGYNDILLIVVSIYAILSTITSIIMIWCYAHKNVASTKPENWA